MTIRRWRSFTEHVTDIIGQYRLKVRRFAVFIYLCSLIRVFQVVRFIPTDIANVNLSFLASDYNSELSLRFLE